MSGYVWTNHTKGKKKKKKEIVKYEGVLLEKVDDIGWWRKRGCPFEAHKMIKFGMNLIN